MDLGGVRGEGAVAHQSPHSLSSSYAPKWSNSGFATAKVNANGL